MSIMSYRMKLSEVAVKRLLGTFGRFGMWSRHTPKQFQYSIIKIDGQLQKRRKYEQRT
jgi:hypothetical protein